MIEDNGVMRRSTSLEISQGWEVLKWETPAYPVSEISHLIKGKQSRIAGYCSCTGNMIVEIAPVGEPALWFSRHEPTEAQLDEIISMGYELFRGGNLGAIDIQDIATAKELVSQIIEGRWNAVFGVFPVPFLHVFPSRVSCALYGSWNIARTPEGGKPTFEHKQWLRVK